MFKLKQFLVFYSCVFFASYFVWAEGATFQYFRGTATAQPILDLSEVSTSSNIKIGNQTPDDSSKIYLHIYASCHSEPIARVKNPLSSKIAAHTEVTLSTKTGSEPEDRSGFSFKVPNSFFFKEATSGVNFDALESTFDNTVIMGKENGRHLSRPGYLFFILDKASYFGNHLDDISGASLGKLKDALQVIQLSQLGTGRTDGAGYVGFDGDISYTPKTAKVSSDGRSITLNLRVPGEILSGENFTFASICGAYHSPIMLSFKKDSYPVISAQVKFPIHPVYSKVYWPEIYNDTYFLVLDEDGDGFIRNEKEVFGDSLGKFKNGFDNLARFDNNKDNRLNEKDAVWTKLKLWQDLNTDGVGSPDELLSLSDKKVQWISVGYNSVSITMKNAKVKQVSKFGFSKKNGRTVVGQAWDYWFKPAGGELKLRKGPHLYQAGVRTPSALSSEPNSLEFKKIKNKNPNN